MWSVLNTGGWEKPGEHEHDDKQVYLTWRKAGTSKNEKDKGIASSRTLYCCYCGIVGACCRVNAVRMTCSMHYALRIESCTLEMYV